MSQRTHPKSKITKRVDRWVKKTGQFRYMLADIIGCHPQTLYSIETGRQLGPNGERLLKILKKAGV